MPKRGNIWRDFQGLGYAFTFIYYAKFNLLTGNKVYEKKLLERKYEEYPETVRKDQTFAVSLCPYSGTPDQITFTVEKALLLLLDSVGVFYYSSAVFRNTLRPDQFCRPHSVAFTRSDGRLGSLPGHHHRVRNHQNQPPQECPYTLR